MIPKGTVGEWPSSMVDVSVVIVTHNNENDIEECLASIISQRPAPREIIVIDSGSTDGTVQLASSFTRVRVAEAKRNIGYAAGNNLGIRLAKGEYIVFLNPDTVVEESWLRELINAMNSCSSPAICQSRIVRYDNPSILNSDGNCVSIVGFAWAGSNGLPRNSDQAMKRIAYPSGASMIVRRDIIDQIGGFDEEFFMYHEDLDFGYRAWLSGHSVWCEPKSVARHKYKDVMTDFKFYHLEKNRLMFLIKNLEPKSLLALLLTLLVVEAGVLMGATTCDKLRAKLHSYVGVLKSLNHVIAERRRIKAIRKRHDNELWFLFEQELPRLGFVPSVFTSSINPLIRVTRRILTRNQTMEPPA